MLRLGFGFGSWVTVRFESRFWSMFWAGFGFKLEFGFRIESQFEFAYRFEFDSSRFRFRFGETGYLSLTSYCLGSEKLDTYH